MWRLEPRNGFHKASTSGLGFSGIEFIAIADDDRRIHQASIEISASSAAAVPMANRRHVFRLPEPGAGDVTGALASGTTTGSDATGTGGAAACQAILNLLFGNSTITASFFPSTR